MNFVICKFQCLTFTLSTVAVLELNNGFVRVDVHHTHYPIQLSSDKLCEFKVNLLNSVEG